MGDGCACAEGSDGEGHGDEHYGSDGSGGDDRDYGDDDDDDDENGGRRRRRRGKKPVLNSAAMAESIEKEGFRRTAGLGTHRMTRGAAKRCV